MALGLIFTFSKVYIIKRLREYFRRITANRHFSANSIPD
ncbi:uncharacterized protein FFE2_14782 [Fusarium fujikuroi]|nr:uncharacterized protein FFE2_14782 [Fusarium fujikuroi]